MADGVLRKSDSLIELLLDKRPNDIQSIRIETSADLVIWNPLATIPSKDSPPDPGWAESFRGKVFYPFDPADATDPLPFWMRFVDIKGGVDDAISDTYLALYAERGSRDYYVLTGTAPNAGSISGSVGIVLPRSYRTTLITAGTLAVAIDPTGPEQTFTGTKEFVHGVIDRLWLRGSGGAADFTLQFTTKF